MAVHEGDAQHEQGSRDRADHEVLQPGLGRAQVVATEGHQDVGEDRHQLEADEHGQHVLHARHEHDAQKREEQESRELPVSPVHAPQIAHREQEQQETDHEHDGPDVDRKSVGGPAGHEDALHATAHARRRLHKQRVARRRGGEEQHQGDGEAAHARPRSCHRTASRGQQDLCEDGCETGTRHHELGQQAVQVEGHGEVHDQLSSSPGAGGWTATSGVLAWASWMRLTIGRTPSSARSSIGWGQKPKRSSTAASMT